MANSCASATPIPALAPVTKAHFPRHSAVIFFASCLEFVVIFSRPQLEPLFCKILVFSSLRGVADAPAFVPDAPHQLARPHKFRCQQTEPEKNHRHSRPQRNQQTDTCQQQGKPSKVKPAMMRNTRRTCSTVRRVIDPYGFLAERVGYSPSRSCHPIMFSATCMKTA